MGLIDLLIIIVIGIIAGWLAGLITRGRGFGLLGNLIVGVIGAFLGSWIFGAIGLAAHGDLARFAMAVGGAVIFVFILGFIKR